MTKNDLNKTDLNKKIIGMISDANITTEEIIRFVQEKAQKEQLRPTTLGLLFELIAFPNVEDFKDGVSREILLSELTKIHPSFARTNGCHWARSDNSYLGRKYIIERSKKGNRVNAIKLCGWNESEKKNRGRFNQEIYKKIKARRCAAFDIGTNIEVDHKNGRYDDPRALDPETQTLDDFQALSKAANDAKRYHCKRCRETGKRYDARRLGFSVGWVEGDENYESCKGCYWYDIIAFRKEISKGYIKD